MTHLRCKACDHRPRRVVSATVKTAGAKKLAEPRLHKKTCDCKCHAAPVAQVAP